MQSTTETTPIAHPALGGFVLALLVLAILSFTLASDYDVPSGLEPLDQPAPALDLGTYMLRPEDVIDGDSLRLPEVGSVRVLGIDCEEVFRSARDRAASKQDFAAYARARRGESPVPVKYATPAGEAAGDAARALVATAGRVRLERDDTVASDLDAHGRTLAHVVLLAPEGEVLLAEALIAEGHSPYFVKYGRSRRFHRRLQRAEQVARTRRRGIWSDSGPHHYPDYEERLAWWHARDDQVERWRHRPDAPGRVALEDRTAEDRLRGLVGREATVFGLLRNRKNQGFPRILWLRHVGRRDFPVVCFDLAVWDSLDHEALRQRFVTVTGRITLYRDRPQILVEHATQIGTP